MPFERRRSHRSAARRGERRPPLLADVIYCQDHEKLLLVPYAQVALLRDEGTGRLEATAADGQVGHRVGSTASYEDGPWVRLAPGVLGHPAHALREGRDLVFPGGWRIPFEGDTPKAPREPAEAIVEAIGAAPVEVLYLEIPHRPPDQSHDIRGAWWVTDRGRLPARASTRREAAAQHGGLIRVGRRLVNPRRIRAIAPHGHDGVLTFDSGLRLDLTKPAMRKLRGDLGIPSYDYIVWQRPDLQGLFLFGLRDFPFEIAEASREQLQVAFGGDERRLVANLVWQVARLRRVGHALAYGDSHRGFWYDPLLPVLTRAGLARKVPPGEIISVTMEGFEPFDHYMYFLRTLSRMIESFRLFDFADLGFVEPRPELRRIGVRRPDVVLVVEKDTVAPFVWELSQRFGISVIILGGQPALISTEFFAKALLVAGCRKVRLVAYVDFDPEVGIIAKAFGKQLARYDVKAEAPRYMVRPSRFTADELKQVAIPVSMRSKEGPTMLRAWLRESGGVRRKALGIHLDHLRPLERVVEAFVEEAGSLAQPLAEGLPVLP